MANAKMFSHVFPENPVWIFQIRFQIPPTSFTKLWKTEPHHWNLEFLATLCGTLKLLTAYCNQCLGRYSVSLSDWWSTAGLLYVSKYKTYFLMELLLLLQFIFYVCRIYLERQYGKSLTWCSPQVTLVKTVIKPANGTPKLY